MKKITIIIIESEDARAPASTETAEATDPDQQDLLNDELQQMLDDYD